MVVVVAVNKSVKASEVKDGVNGEGVKIGHDLHALDVDVILKCRWRSGAVMIGSMSYEAFN